MSIWYTNTINHILYEKDKKNTSLKATISNHTTQTFSLKYVFIFFKINKMLKSKLFNIRSLNSSEMDAHSALS